jgi:hypothetical protein
MESVDSRKLPREGGGQKQDREASILGSFLGREGGAKNKNRERRFQEASYGVSRDGRDICE